MFWKAGEKATGLAKHVVVAAFIGLSSQLDVFYMAMAFLGMIVFSWAQLLDVIAVPRLVEYHRKSEYKQFQMLSGGLFVFCIGLSTVLTIAIVAGKSLLAKAAIGFDGDRQQLLAEAFVWLAPALLLSIPLQFIASVFRSIRRFSIFYQAQFCIAAVGLGLIILFREHATILLWSYSAGVVVAFCFLMFYARGLFRPWGNPFAPEIVSVWKMAPGLLMLQLSQNLYELTDKVFTSFLSLGSVGALAYGRNLAYVTEGMLGLRGSFITIFAEAHESADRKNEIYNDILSFSIFIAVPTSVFLFFFGDALIAFFLERGLFSNLDTRMVFTAVIGYSWGLLPFVMIGPLEQIFQVQQRVDLLVRRKIVSVIINGAFSAFFLFVLKLGIFGIALATSVSFWVVLIWGILTAARTGLILEVRKASKWLIWMAASSFAGVLAAQSANMFFGRFWAIIFETAIFTTIVAVGGGLYMGREGELVRQTIRRVVLTRFSKKSL